jgi:hypothetical protein
VELPIPELVENRRHSVAMLSPGANWSALAVILVSVALFLEAAVWIVRNWF